MVGRGWDKLYIIWVGNPGNCTTNANPGTPPYETSHVTSSVWVTPEACTYASLPSCCIIHIMARVNTHYVGTLLQCLPMPMRKLSGLMSRWMKFLLWTNSILPIICTQSWGDKSMHEKQAVSRNNSIQIMRTKCIIINTHGKTGYVVNTECARPFPVQNETSDNNNKDDITLSHVTNGQSYWSLLGTDHCSRHQWCVCMYVVREDLNRV